MKNECQPLKQKTITEASIGASTKSAGLMKLNGACLLFPSQKSQMAWHNEKNEQKKCENAHPINKIFSFSRHKHLVW